MATIKTRILSPHKTKEQWEQDSNFSPLPGEIIICDPVEDSNDFSSLYVGETNKKFSELYPLNGVLQLNSNVDLISDATDTTNTKNYIPYVLYYNKESDDSNNNTFLTQNDLDALEQKLTNSLYKGKTYSIIGTKYDVSYQTDYYTYIDPSKTDYNEDECWWKKLFSNTLGMTLDMSHFLEIGSDKSLTTMKDLANNCTSITFSNFKYGPDYFIITIGRKDWINYSSNNYTRGTYDGTISLSAYSLSTKDTSSFSYSYGVLLTYLLSTYPQSNIIMCTLPLFPQKTTLIGYPVYSTSNARLENYNYIIMEIAKAYGIQILPLHTCGITPYNKQYLTKSGTVCLLTKDEHRKIVNHAIRILDPEIRTQYT